MSREFIHEPLDIDDYDIYENKSVKEIKYIEPSCGLINHDIKIKDYKYSRENKDTIGQIEELLNLIIPQLKLDGGNIEIVGFKDNQVDLRLKGSCSTCGLLGKTMFEIEKTVLKEIKSINKVNWV